MMPGATGAGLDSEDGSNESLCPVARAFNYKMAIGEILENYEKVMARSPFLKCSPEFALLFISIYSVTSERKLKTERC
jgi:hypothetical protein